MSSPRKLSPRPDQVLLDYLEQAIDELGLRAWAALLWPGNPGRFQHRLAQAINPILLGWAEQRQEAAVLQDPEKFLRWEPWREPENEIEAYYALQGAISATLMGDTRGYSVLRALLITEPMNRKLAISYFLGNFTAGRIGASYQELPTKAQVLDWSGRLIQAPPTNRLEELAQLKRQLLV